MFCIVNFILNCEERTAIIGSEVFLVMNNYLDNVKNIVRDINGDMFNTKIEVVYDNICYLILVNIMM